MSVSNRKNLVLRAWRLFALFLLLCILGTSFFLLHRPQQEEETATSSYAEGISVTQKDSAKSSSRRYIEGPDPATFRLFLYDPANPEMTVEGECSDRYYSVLIYSKKIDYRESPLDARYNVATECPKNRVYKAIIKLDTLPLVPGEEYYVIQAQQGMGGQWYNAQ